MKSNTKLPVCLAVLVAASLSLGKLEAGSPPINGTINFASGFVTFDTGAIGTARSITSFSNVVIGTATGAYAPLTNSVVSWTPFTFKPPAVSVKPLWTVTNSGVVYSFDSTSITVVFQNSGYLNLRGTGVAHITGYADTPGTWTLAGLLNGPNYTVSGTELATNANFPTISLVSQTNGVISFSWNSLPGQTYQVEYTTDLLPASWQALGDPIIASDTTTATNDTPPPAGRRYYRIGVPY